MTNNKNKFLRLIIGFNLLLLLNSCSPVPASYKYKEIPDTIEDICEEEFGVKTTVYPFDETIWIYAPFNNLLNEDGTIKEEKQKKIRNIFLSLRRAVLSTDNPPLFYIMVASNIKGQGADIYYVGFVPDIVKLELRFISREEFSDRIIMFSFMNPDALGDKTGKHISAAEMTTGYFIAYLTRQNLINFYFEDRETQIEKIEVSYQNRNIKISTDIKQEDKTQPKPFDKTKQILKDLLNTYEEFSSDIALIEIEDKNSQLKRTYSVKTLLNK